MITEHEMVKELAISAKRGMLPAVDPVLQFANKFQLYLDIATKIPELLAAKQLRIEVDRLSDAVGPLTEQIEHGTMAELQRAYSVLATLCNAYIFEHRNTSDKELPVRIPQHFAQAFFAIATKLGIKPTQTYYSYVIQNWRLIDPAREISLENTDVLVTYTNFPDEKGFIKLHVVCEALAGEAIYYGVKLNKLLQSKSEFDAAEISRMITYLQAIATSIHKVTEILGDLIKVCNPKVFYEQLRPYVKPFEKGIIFTGVSDRPMIFRGPSGAQTCIFAILDRLMGIPVTTLDYMLPYMTEDHRQVIGSFDPNLLINKFERIDSADLEQARVAVAHEIKLFREKHLSLIYQEYETAFAHDKEGTGSTYYRQFLSNNITRTSLTECPFSMWAHRPEMPAESKEGEDALRELHYPITIAMDSEVSARLTEVAVYGYQLKLTPTSEPEYKEEVRTLHTYWQGKKEEDVASLPLLQAYIAFNLLLGLDAKKTPPSTLNLICRCLLAAESKFPFIHPIVDFVNIAAVETLIPLGVFDASCVKGELKLAYSKGGESFLPLGGKSPEKLKASILVLRDDEKVLSKFGVRDSQAQKITSQTQTVWLLACKVPGVDQANVIRAMDKAIDKLKKNYAVEYMRERHYEPAAAASVVKPA